MTIIWGFSTDEKLTESKRIGKEISEVKQIFSALLFKSGIKGVIVQIESILESGEATIQLVIDNECCFSKNLSLRKPGEHMFEMEDVIIPQTKIEIILAVTHGYIELPTSSIGNGMGFQKINDTYQPTKHLGLGLIIP